MAKMLIRLFRRKREERDLPKGWLAPEATAVWELLRAWLLPIDWPKVTVSARNDRPLNHLAPERDPVSGASRVRRWLHQEQHALLTSSCIFSITTPLPLFLIRSIVVHVRKRGRVCYSTSRSRGSNASFDTKHVGFLQKSFLDKWLEPHTWEEQPEGPPKCASRNWYQRSSKACTSCWLPPLRKHHDPWHGRQARRQQIHPPFHYFLS